MGQVRGIATAAKMNCWEFLNCGRQPGGGDDRFEGGKEGENEGPMPEQSRGWETRKVPGRARITPYYAQGGLQEAQREREGRNRIPVPVIYISRQTNLIQD